MIILQNAREHKPKIDTTHFILLFVLMTNSYLQPKQQILQSSIQNQNLPEGVCLHNYVQN